MEIDRSKDKITHFMWENIAVVVYGILSVFLELFSLLYVDCKPYITQPIFAVLMLAFLLSILSLTKRKRIKVIASIGLLFIQSIIIIACYYLYFSNGTVFEISMLSQRNDAYATVEQFYVVPGLLITCVTTFLCYIIFGIFHIKRSRKKGSLKVLYSKRVKVALITVSCVLLVTFLAIPIIDKLENRTKDYKSILYHSNNNYQRLGFAGNLAYEFIRGNSKVNTDNLDNLDKSIYSKRCDVSQYNGVSKGNNLIMILAESFEWYPMKMYSEDITKKLYPNLYKLIADSVTCDNFYSKEKTDTAEALTLIGSNPTGKYVHYGFENNEYPYSLPNLFRQEANIEGDTDVVIRSYHQNSGKFYNRRIAHKSFGFERLVDLREMKKYGVKDTWYTPKRERNLDSLTIDAMKDQMFQKDHRFFTYWITFSTHGFYKKRDNLKEYYDKFDKLGVFPEGNQNQNYLRTYAAAVADLDKAIGIMFDDLKKKGLLEKTTIVMVADHNTYYNSLSNYVKNINTRFKPELYRVPMIIYDQKLVSAIDDQKESRSITKFTTTSDVIPTVLDLFGIPGWKNLYLGSTVLNKDKESIIYSRAYNIFITDKYIGYSLRSMKYKCPKATKETKKDFEKRALTHLKRLEMLDKIFYSNYFATHKYKP